MASGTISTRPPEEAVLAQGRYDDFIEKRLEHTRRQVRLVDVGSGLVLLAAASLFFFLAVAVADHWLFPHGLGFTARLLLWVVWVAVAGWFAWRSVAPSIVRRINPVFAAQAIEHGRPTLKNSLINFLLLRSHPDDVAPVVYRAMEHRAAADLSRVPVEQAVDRHRLVHLCYVLAGAVVLFALYLAFSPKNPLVSAARVLWPWSTLPAPTRVHIEDVQPGNAVAFQGDRQQISARVSGLRSGEEVSLLLSTADGEFTDDHVPMARGEDDHYACELPPGTGSLQQDTFYRITAGDATTPQFKLEVHIAPTILVDQVDYDYPPYTGMPHRTVKGQGDVRGLEGTKVTIHATTNLPDKNAEIDLAAVQTRRMKSSGTQAAGDFTLALDPAQNWRPLFDRYQLVFCDPADRKFQHPIQYRIDVDRDNPPEITIVDPKEDAAPVGENGQLKIRVHAMDDFGLRHIALHAECDGRQLDLPVLLDRIVPDKAFTKPYDGDYNFRPAALGLHKGDLVTYWAEAVDNKEPEPNRVETQRRTIRIVDDQAAAQGQQNQGQQGDEQGQHSNQTQQGGNAKGMSQPGEKGQGDESGDGGANGKSSSNGKEGANQKNDSQDAQGGKSGAKNSQNGQRGKDGTSSDSNNGDKGDSGASDNGGQEKRPLDPKNQAADAIKDSLKDLKKKQEQSKQGTAGDNSPSNQANDSGQQNQNQQNTAQQAANQQAGNQPNGGQQNGSQQTGTQQSANQPNASQQGGNQQAANQQTGVQQNAGQQNANQQAGNQQSANQQNAGQPSGNQGANQQNAGQQTGNQQAANQQIGNQQTANQQTASQQSGNQQTGNRQSSNPQAGNQQPGNQPTASEQNGKQQTGNQSAENKQQGGNSTGQENRQEKAASSSDKSGTNSGQANKPNANQGGTQGKDSQTSAGAQPAKEKMSGGQLGGSQTAGTPNNNEKNPSGAQGADDHSQSNTNGAKPEKNNSPPGGNSMSQPLPAGSKQGNQPKTESGNASGSSQNSQAKKDKQEQSGGASSGGEQQPKPGQGQQPSSGGKQSANGAKGGDQGNMANGQPRQMEQGKSGEPTRQNSSGAPDSQVDPQRSGNKSGDAQQGVNPSDKSQSPGNSPHDSDSTSETPGDRKGGGGKGGGQPDKKPGKGSAGSSSAADKGGAVSNEKGGDANGNKAGEAMRAGDKTGSQHKEAGSGGEKPQASGKQTSDNAPKSPNNSSQNAAANQPNSGGQPGAASQQPASQGGSAFPTGGSRAGNQPPPPTEDGSQSKPDQVDLEASKKQVDMALRHIKDEMAKPKSELMDRIGWTPEQAKKFVENIEKLRDSANQPGNEGAAKSYNEFLKDLGLRPHGTRIDSSKAGRNDVSRVRDAGQLAPPAEWDEVSKQYSRTTAGGQK